MALSKKWEKNGCQITALIDAARVIISGLHRKFPCEENSRTINCLTEALAHQRARTQRRESRGIEGTSQEE